MSFISADVVFYQCIHFVVSGSILAEAVVHISCNLANRTMEEVS